MRYWWPLCFFFLTTVYSIEQECGKSPKPSRIYARHIEPKGIGYNDGYSTLEIFFMPFEHFHDVWTPFLDLRGHIFNDRKAAANIGIGMRSLASRVWGFNVYWDYRKTRRHAYNQVTIGAESLGKVFDFRMNGYISVGVSRSHFFRTKLESVQGRFDLFSNEREFSLQGVNAEAAMHIDSFKHFPLYFAAGPYYLIGSRHATWGGQLRAALEISEYVVIEGNTSYDHLYKWIGQGQVSLILPCGKRRRIRPSSDCPKAVALEKRMVQRIDRSEIIPVQLKHNSSKKLQSRGIPIIESLSR